MKRVRDIALAPTAAFCALAAATGGAHAQQEVPAAALRSGTLGFIAHSTTGDFVGTTTSVAGAVAGGTGFATAHGWAEAPVRSLATGIGLRDHHLRAALQADRFPTIRFDLKGVRAAAPLADGARVTLVGAMTIHGVTREVEVPATLERRADTVHVTSAFPLRLHDYGIQGVHRMLGLLRVRDDIEVRAALDFVDAARQAVTTLAPVVIVATSPRGHTVSTHEAAARPCPRPVNLPAGSPVEPLVHSAYEYCDQWRSRPTGLPAPRHR